MKKTFLKTAHVVSAAAILFFIAYSCNKQKLTSADEPQTQESTLKESTRLAAAADDAATREANPFKRTVGAPIDGKTGRQWIKNFNQASLNLGIRNSGMSYVIQAESLQAMLRNSSCVGICLYYALDDRKQVHILPIGVNENGRLMKSESISTQGGAIDWDTAQKWIANDPGAIDARFFGRNTFDRLFSDRSCRAVRATFAADNHRNPQLLLSNAASIRVRTYEDDSAQCPPVCALVEQQRQ